VYCINTTTVGKEGGVGHVRSCSRLIRRQIPLDQDVETALLKLMV